MRLVYCRMIIIDNKKAEIKRLNIIEWLKLLLMQIMD